MSVIRENEVVKFLNYFDIPEKEFKNKDIMSYLRAIYKKLGVPEGQILAWYSLPHENQDMKRICVYYRTEDKIIKKAAK